MKSLITLFASLFLTSSAIAGNPAGVHAGVSADVGLLPMFSTTATVSSDRYHLVAGVGYGANPAVVTAWSATVGTTFLVMDHPKAALRLQPLVGVMRVTPRAFVDSSARFGNLLGYDRGLSRKPDVFYTGQLRVQGARRLTDAVSVTAHVTPGVGISEKGAIGQLSAGLGVQF